MNSQNSSSIPDDLDLLQSIERTSALGKTGSRLFKWLPSHGVNPMIDTANDRIKYLFKLYITELIALSEIIDPIEQKRILENIGELEIAYLSVIETLRDSGVEIDFM